MPDNQLFGDSSFEEHIQKSLRIKIKKTTYRFIKKCLSSISFMKKCLSLSFLNILCIYGSVQNCMINIFGQPGSLFCVKLESKPMISFS